MDAEVIGDLVHRVSVGSVGSRNGFIPGLRTGVLPAKSADHDLGGAARVVKVDGWNVAK